jgi:uncharacterized linocin/CFP29 family protein
VPLGEEPSDYVDAVARATMALADRGVAGPYALVLGPEPFQRLSADVSTYPPRQRIAALIEGPILHSRALDGGVLLSIRGGDFEMVVGQDVSLGYQHHGAATVHLYLMESFTFRIHAPEAAVTLPAGDPDVTLVEAAAGARDEAVPRRLSTDLEVKIEA